jgi:inhibitor of KinA
VYQQPRFLPAGDRSLVVELGDEISPDINRRIRDLVLAIEHRRIAGVVDLVPTYRSLLVYCDPLRVSLTELEREIAGLERHLGETPLPPPKVVEIPTCYGGWFGPDLEFVASHCKLTPDEVVRVHTGADYLVYMMGFTPGFTYLGGMSERIATPRLKTPRTLIPAGSVGIAQQQTGIYPVDSPGGWQLIGRTPVRLFDPQRDPPVVVEAGDYVRFAAIDRSTYDEIERQVQAGAYRLSVREQR